MKLQNFKVSMTKKPSELIFISRILRDGSGVEPINPEMQKDLENDRFERPYVLNRLSISKDTWIASGFNSYIVRIKQDENTPIPHI